MKTKKMLGIFILVLCMVMPIHADFPVGFAVFNEYLMDILPVIFDDGIPRLGTSFGVITIEKLPKVREILNIHYRDNIGYGNRTALNESVRTIIRILKVQDLPYVREKVVFVFSDGLNNVWLPRKTRTQELTELKVLIKEAANYPVPIQVIPIEVRPGNNYDNDLRDGIEELLALSSNGKIYKLIDFANPRSELNMMIENIAADTKIAAYFALDNSVSLKNNKNAVSNSVEHAIALLFKNEAKSTEPEFVYIPPVSGFLVGNNNDPTASPAHRVSISGFHMKTWTVTESEYYGLCGTPSEAERFKDSMRPMSCSWFQTTNYCNALSRQQYKQPAYILLEDGTVQLDTSSNGYRLPTESEWEYAARSGTTSTLFHTGNIISTEDAVFDSSEILPVKSTRPNTYGLYDMLGNVREWIWDWFGPYNSEETLNPTGPAAGVAKVLKGGSYLEPMSALHITARYYEPPNFVDDYIGFRIVFPVDPKK